jgi:adenylate cyclase class 2
MEALMATEIELKAWVESPEELKKHLQTLGIYDCAYDKSDTYWVFGEETGKPGPIPPSGVRIRREIETKTDEIPCSRVLVTYKVKEISSGIEVNDEREFEISPENAMGRGTAAFEGLLERLGLRPAIRKRKQGCAWRCGDIRAELSQVEHLGWFIELEILKEAPDPDTIQQCREQLLFLLEKLGIPTENIEGRPYTKMLAEGVKNPHTSPKGTKT